MSDITTQRVVVDTLSSDERGCLVFNNGKLVAVLLHLEEPDHGPLNGKWFLEHGFGPLDTLNHPVFDSLEIGLEWVGEELK